MHDQNTLEIEWDHMRTRYRGSPGTERGDWMLQRASEIAWGFIRQFGCFGVTSHFAIAKATGNVGYGMMRRVLLLLYRRQQSHPSRPERFARWCIKCLMNGQVDRILFNDGLPDEAFGPDRLGGDTHSDWLHWLLGEFGLPHEASLYRNPKSQMSEREMIKWEKFLFDVVTGS